MFLVNKCSKKCEWLSICTALTVFFLFVSIIQQANSNEVVGGDSRLAPFKRRGWGKRSVFSFQSDIPQATEDHWDNTDLSGINDSGEERFNAVKRRGWGKRSSSTNPGYPTKRRGWGKRSTNSNLLSLLDALQARQALQQDGLMQQNIASQVDKRRGWGKRALGLYHPGAQQKNVDKRRGWGKRAVLPAAGKRRGWGKRSSDTIPCQKRQQNDVVNTYESLQI